MLTLNTVARIVLAAAAASFSAELVLKLKYMAMVETRSAEVKSESTARALILRKKRFATITLRYGRSDIGNETGTQIVYSLVPTVTSLYPPKAAPPMSEALVMFMILLLEVFIVIEGGGRGVEFEERLLGAMDGL